MATPRRPRSLLAPRSNPLRDLVAQKNRALETARERKRVQELKTELPSLIQDRVGDHIQKLEDRLLTEVKELGERAVQESTAAISQQLNGRIETLEKASAQQTQTLASLSDSSRTAERKVSEVVAQIEQSLAAIVPGFALDPPRAYPAPQVPAPPTVIYDTPRIESSLKMPAVPTGERLSFSAVPPAVAGVHPQFLPEPPMEVVVADPMEMTEAVGKFSFCPSCTSTDVRRANRVGMFESFLRLFFIAPFRCRSCRHKFYRF